MMRALFKSNTVESFQCLFLVSHRVEVLRQHHVFQRSEVGNEMELLKDKSDLLCAKAIQF